MLDSVRFLLLFLVGYTLFSGSSLPARAQNPAHVAPFGMGKVVFEDSFDSPPLDTSRWGYRSDSKHWSTQVRENVQIRDGQLVLVLRKDSVRGKAYTGAGVISRQTFGEGLYEARLICPRTAGWHTSFWLMRHDGSGGTSPDSADLEIDILENDSRITNGYHANLHRWKGGHRDFVGNYVACPTLQTEFQELAAWVRADSILYYLNQKVVRKESRKDLPFGPMHIWLTSIASHLGNTKAVDDSQLPQEARIDWVRYSVLPPKTATSTTKPKK